MSPNNLGLSELEDSQLKTICEYLFFDQFKDYATFPRFEQCFQPLFNEVNISLDSVFKEICGPKKKYINYPRLVNAYRKYKLQTRPTISHPVTRRPRLAAQRHTSSKQRCTGATLMDVMFIETWAMP